MHKLFIGMPVYNGSRFIAEAIESVINQSYCDWKMLISDNASDDGTEQICRGYCKKEDRIHYDRHERNYGALHNFKYLLDQADAEYFMWASADDVWFPGFVKAGIEAMDNNPAIAMSFSNIVCIDTYGRICRDVPKLDRFSTKNSLLNIYRFVKDPEISGKANLFYSIYRTIVVRDAWQMLESFEPGAAANDICFVLSILARHRVFVSPEVLFKKRWIRPDDDPSTVHFEVFRDGDYHLLQFNDALKGYLKSSLMAVRNTKYYFLALAVLAFRLASAYIRQRLGRSNTTGMQRNHG